MTTPETYSEEECLNVYWKIKNFSYCCSEIRSPEFVYRGYMRRLRLKPGFVNVECSISYDYSRDFKIEISFLTCDGSPEESISGDKDSQLKVPKDVIFGNRRNAFLPEDTLTVRFRSPTETERGNVFICSQIGLKRNYFLWTFKYLSDHGFTYKKSAEKSALYGDIELRLASLYGINSDEQFSMEISRTGGERCYCFLKISVLGVDGKALNEESDEFVLQKQDVPLTRGFPSIIKRSKWNQYKKLLLSEDTLSLKCYLGLSTGTVTDQTAVISYCESATPLLKESDDFMRAFKEETDSSPVTELQTDLKSILESGTLHDVSLQIGSEVMQAHKNILGARSPVFRAMFEKDMKEANSSTVVIEDFDVETVRRLLLYMYTDSIGNGEWESTKKLYYAADKYEVLSLKESCVSFLKTNLSVCNVCEALVLADLHRDAYLKSAALDFVSEYDSVVFASGTWREFEKNNSLLAFEVLREICCNK